MSRPSRFNSNLQLKGGKITWECRKSTVVSEMRKIRTRLSKTFPYLKERTTILFPTKTTIFRIGSISSSRYFPSARPTPAMRVCDWLTSVNTSQAVHFTPEHWGRSSGTRNTPWRRSSGHENTTILQLTFCLLKYFQKTILYCTV